MFGNGLLGATMSSITPSPSPSHTAQPPVAPAVVADVTMCFSRSLPNVTSVRVMFQMASTFSGIYTVVQQHTLLTKVSAVDLTFSDLSTALIQLFSTYSQTSSSLSGQLPANKLTLSQRCGLVTSCHAHHTSTSEKIARGVVFGFFVVHTAMLLTFD